MSFRYIGSKARLASELHHAIGSPSESFFIDAFCGTGAVSEVAAELGWKVRFNDTLFSAVVLTHARLLSKNAVFGGSVKRYAELIDELNAMPSENGVIWREYSPASKQNLSFERRYFTESNASKIDAIRNKISNLKSSGEISKSEEMLLIADLLNATNSVANIAGTYGCFLSQWTSQSQKALKLKARNLKDLDVVFDWSVGDALNVKCEGRSTVYLDPPYTKRQYASYYHIPETIAYFDDPKVEGVSGLRPWKSLASDFCYKSRAIGALEQLMDSLSCSRVLLSYSCEGHIAIKDIIPLLERYGSLRHRKLKDVGRYRPNQASLVRSEVTEHLFEVLCEKDSHIKSSNLEAVA